MLPRSRYASASIIAPRRAPPLSCRLMPLLFGVLANIWNITAFLVEDGTDPVNSHSITHVNARSPLMPSWCDAGPVTVLDPSANPSFRENAGVDG